MTTATTGSRWYWWKNVGILYQFPERKYYGEAMPDGSPAAATEEECIAAGDQLLTDSEARDKIAAWRKPNNPAAAVKTDTMADVPEPSPTQPAEVLWSGEVDGKRYEKFKATGCDRCVACWVGDLCETLRVAANGCTYASFRLASQPAPTADHMGDATEKVAAKAEAAPEQLWLTRDGHSGKWSEGHIWLMEPATNGAAVAGYTLTSAHEAKVKDWRTQYEVVTQRMQSEIEQQRAEAKKWSDFSKEVQADRDRLTARVAELEKAKEQWRSDNHSLYADNQRLRQQAMEAYGDGWNDANDHDVRQTLVTAVWSGCGELESDLSRERSRFVFVTGGAK